MSVQNLDADWQAIAPTPDVGALSRPVAGSPGATLTVDGTGFVRRSVVRWNGGDRPTTFVSRTRLTAQLTAADVAAPGTAQVTVFTTPAGGGLSVARTATVDPAPPPPKLAVTSVRVRSKWARSRVTGSVRVRGTAERAGRVEVALLTGAGRAARVVARRRANLAAGAFAVAVPLPRTLLPGRLTVRMREVGRRDRRRPDRGDPRGPSSPPRARGWSGARSSAPSRAGPRCGGCGPGGACSPTSASPPTPGRACR